MAGSLGSQALSVARTGKWLFGRHLGTVWLSRPARLAGPRPRGSACGPPVNCARFAAVLPPFRAAKAGCIILLRTLGANSYGARAHCCTASIALQGRFGDGLIQSPSTVGRIPSGPFSCESLGQLLRDKWRKPAKDVNENVRQVLVVRGIVIGSVRFL